ncbi:hypothetical protein [Clostridium sp.]|jgi:hypothetical protein|uniref:hypothetical protein n=1 Tax=Clostridium sp. TaxID=1506 RepID=UPI0029006D80|nr:hypothetical protein [Clostridium sp.]MDU2158621.1 hypothetical protein [Clostridium sp.]
MKSVKYIRISKDEMENRLYACKKFSESLEKSSIIIQQFNLLPSNKRKEISNEFSKSEEKLKSTARNFNFDMYRTCLIVEINIIASKYDIDPATVLTCINSPCKYNERIIVT